MWFYYLISIIIHLIFLPFWFIDKNGTVALIEMFVGTIIIPIYLVVVTSKFSDKFTISKSFIILIIMIAISIFGNLITYFNWGISTGLLTTPDSETVLIIKSQIFISATIISVGWIILSLIKKSR